MTNESYKQVAEECASATRMHIDALYEVQRRLSPVGEQSFIYATVQDVREGLEITASKLETL